MTSIMPVEASPTPRTGRTKLIEVSLPLEAINTAAAHEKMPGIGAHPRGIHLWWARRPLATCRAVLFASLVDDPGAWPEDFPTEHEQQHERQRLHDLIKELVRWENSNNQDVLGNARKEIGRSIARAKDLPLPVSDHGITRFLVEHAPPILDPFCGGGSIPLEAQRLGLAAHASDLNPVPVLITKALIELPPKFAGQTPVNPRDNKGIEASWPSTSGLIADVRYYGQWMRDEAEKRVGHLYPKVKLPKEQGGGEATVIAWLWARTVKCPNPACGAQMPLVTSFWLSTKPGKKVWLEPVVDRKAKSVTFEIRSGQGLPADPPKVGRGATFRCLVCEQTASNSSIRDEFKAKHNGTQLLAVVAEGKGGRTYLPPNHEQDAIAHTAVPTWKPEQEMNQETSNLVSGRGYGITHWHEIFTPRQLVALTTFSDLVGEARARVLAGVVQRKLSPAAIWTQIGNRSMAVLYSPWASPRARRE